MTESTFRRRAEPSQCASQTPRCGRRTGEGAGPSESEPTGFEQRPAKRSRPSPWAADVVPVLSCTCRARSATLGIASSQPSRRCSATAVSMCRPMFHVRDVVSAASEVLRSSSPYALVMPEALACRRIFLVSPARVPCCTWDSALRRAAAGSQKSRRPLPAELERLTYVSPIDSDTLAKRTTQAAYVLILVWARERRSARRQRQEQQHGPYRPWSRR